MSSLQGKNVINISETIEFIDYHLQFYKIGIEI